MTQNKRLQDIARVLRKEQTDFSELAQAMEKYEALIHEVSDIEYGDESNRSDIHFNNGKALGTTWAALCIKDLIRTKSFIKGLFEAIEYKRKTKNGRLHILYAGTGPYATLILPVMAFYTKEIVQFTLLEINEVSWTSAKNVIDQLGFSKYIKANHNQDATKYAIPSGENFDIVLSETMQQALKYEQQVPITMNIISQLKEDVILIPEAIKLEVCLLNLSKLQTRQTNDDETSFSRLGSFFELNCETVRVFKTSFIQEQPKFNFPQKSFVIPPKLLNEFSTLAILTEIDVFGKNQIRINESGLSTPMILEEITELNKKWSLTIHYKVDEKPGIEYRLIGE